MPDQFAALAILALTLGLALGRPRLGRLRIDHAPAAVIGALLCLAFGVVSAVEAGEYLLFLTRPVVTIVSLMAVTVIAEQAGLFDFLARRVAAAARGDAKRLFLYVFALGSVTGALFTNDAAVLIFTPLVFHLVEDVAGDDWTLANKIPYYFAVLYVANVAGVLVISNPVNILVSELLGISFVEYARWMFVPSLVSIAASYLGIRFVFRKSLPERFVALAPVVISDTQRRAMAICALVLGVTLVAFFAGEVTGVPVSVVAACAAIALLAVYKHVSLGNSYASVAQGVSWDVILFLVGIFIVTRGVMSVCITEEMRVAMATVASEHLGPSLHATGFGAATLSALLNNHPTAAMLGVTLADMDLAPVPQRFLAFAALIGSDLGPKMLPIGSLAALIWFGLLRRRGIDISYGLYIRIGVPVTLVALALALVALHLELVLLAL